MGYFVIGGLLIALTVGLCLWFLGPKYHRHIGIQDFERFIDSFIEKMGNGSVLIIEEEGGARFVQFVLYGPPQKRPKLRFGYPQAAWSNAYFMHVKERVESAGYRARIENTTTEEVPRFLEVDIAGTEEELRRRGSEIAQLALRAMGIKDSATFRIHAEGRWIGPPEYRAARR